MEPPEPPSTQPALPPAPPFTQSTPAPQQALPPVPPSTQSKPPPRLAEPLPEETRVQIEEIIAIANIALAETKHVIDSPLFKGDRELANARVEELSLAIKNISTRIKSPTRYPKNVLDTANFTLSKISDFLYELSIEEAKVKSDEEAKVTRELLIEETRVKRESFGKMASQNARCESQSHLNTAYTDREGVFLSVGIEDTQDAPEIIDVPPPSITEPVLYVGLDVDEEVDEDRLADIVLENQDAGVKKILAEVPGEAGSAAVLEGQIEVEPRCAIVPGEGRAEAGPVPGEHTPEGVITIQSEQEITTTVEELTIDHSPLKVRRTSLGAYLEKEKTPPLPEIVLLFEGHGVTKSSKDIQEINIPTSMDFYLTNAVNNTLFWSQKGEYTAMFRKSFGRIKRDSTSRKDFIAKMTMAAIGKKKSTIENSPSALLSKNFIFNQGFVTYSHLTKITNDIFSQSITEYKGGGLFVLHSTNPEIPEGKLLFADEDKLEFTYFELLEFLTEAGVKSVYLMDLSCKDIDAPNEREKRRTARAVDKLYLMNSEVTYPKQHSFYKMKKGEREEYIAQQKDSAEILLIGWRQYKAKAITDLEKKQKILKKQEPTPKEKILIDKWCAEFGSKSNVLKKAEQDVDYWSKWSVRQWVTVTHDKLKKTTYTDPSLATELVKAVQKNTEFNLTRYAGLIPTYEKMRDGFKTIKDTTDELIELHRPLQKLNEEYTSLEEKYTSDDTLTEEEVQQFMELQHLLQERQSEIKAKKKKLHELQFLFKGDPDNQHIYYDNKVQLLDIVQRDITVRNGVNVAAANLASAITTKKDIPQMIAAYEKALEDYKHDSIPEIKDILVKIDQMTNEELKQNFIDFYKNIYGEMKHIIILTVDVPETDAELDLLAEEKDLARGAAEGGRTRRKRFTKKQRRYPPKRYTKQKRSKQRTHSKR